MKKGLFLRHTPKKRTCAPAIFVLHTSDISLMRYAVFPRDIRLSPCENGTNIIPQKPKVFISLLPQGKNIAANISLQYRLYAPKK